MTDQQQSAVLETREAFARAWAEVTKQEIGGLDFTPHRFRDLLRSRWFERRTLADGTPPAVGQRVVTVREVAESWGMAHAHDELVHEITSLLSGDTHLVECGARQIGVRMLRLAPPGAEVTCPSCRGWREQMARLSADSQAFRETQFRVAELERHAERLRAALRSIIAAARNESTISIVELGHEDAVDALDALAVFAEGELGEQQRETTSESGGQHR